MKKLLLSIFSVDEGKFIFKDYQEYKYIKTVLRDEKAQIFINHANFLNFHKYIENFIEVSQYKEKNKILSINEGILTITNRKISIIF